MDSLSSGLGVEVGDLGSGDPSLFIHPRRIPTLTKLWDQQLWSTLCYGAHPKMSIYKPNIDHLNRVNSTEYDQSRTTNPMKTQTIPDTITDCSIEMHTELYYRFKDEFWKCARQSDWYAILHRLWWTPGDSRRVSDRLVKTVIVFSTEIFSWARLTWMTQSFVRRCVTGSSLCSSPSDWRSPPLITVWLDQSIDPRRMIDWVLCSLLPDWLSPLFIIV